MGTTDTPAPAPRRRLTPQERRSEILTAATELISAVGFNATTIDDFARAARMSRPGLLHHFPSRDALLEAVLARRDADTLEAVHRGESAGSAGEAREAVADLIAFNAARPELVRLYTMLAAEALAPDHPAHDYFVRRQALVRTRFQEQVLAWHPTPTAVAVQLIAFIDGLQLVWLRDPSIDMVAQWWSVASGLIRED